jgi:hypothetical protein
METMQDQHNTGQTKYILADGSEISEEEYLKLTQAQPAKDIAEEKAKLPEGGKKK